MSKNNPKHIFVKKYIKGLDGAFTLNCEKCDVELTENRKDAVCHGKN